ncbi:hypothetical protein NEOLI_000873 [Neolecta irregularis DAH-3]|uniref:Acetoacetate decarboxylase n=1 Tax=Neolecta irregularis (strain DAH-3) TaxID=1198029 RepID=A0A1U7LSP1_NEOID|nr:hypothetical protein NEOLI_000873 [Neolecta irregularis DAH-3]|eukprot:OLL25690.1 hypothetical protein NEOLI_000873 [Neolecta irregularis DAH-3]
MSVSYHPAPWSLRGHAFVYLLAPTEYPDPTFIGGFGVLLLIRYFDAPCGPYDELLYSPGRFQTSSGPAYRITKIYVSLMDSVINGRRNWGIPKELAVFHWDDQKGVVQIHVVLPNGISIFEITMKRHYWTKIPYIDWDFLARRLPLVQPSIDENTNAVLPGNMLKSFMSIQASSMVVTMEDCHTDERYFPKIENSGVGRIGINAERFEMIFRTPESIPVTNFKTICNANHGGWFWRFANKLFCKSVVREKVV